MAKRVLIVESLPAAAEEIGARLSRLGYAVEAVADSVARAASLATERAPDVAVIGGEFRDAADGPSVAAAIRIARPMPVVRLLAADAAHDASGREDAALPGPLDLVLPCTDRELRTTLELALCQYHGARATHDLERFFAVSQDMFCFLDFNGYFRRLNPAWERTLGWTREEMMTRRFIEFVHPDDRERTLQQNGQVRGGGMARGFENRYLCRDGSYRWLLWNSAPSTNDRTIYAVARDITARRAAEDERARLIDELQASLAEVQTLQAILPICSYCRRIRDDKDYWDSVESYLARHTRTRFSHGICPHCMATEVEPQLAKLEKD